MLKDLERLAQDLRKDPALRDALATALATAVPGDWAPVVAELTSRGYGVTAEEVQAKLKATLAADAPHAAFLARWL